MARRFFVYSVLVLLFVIGTSIVIGLRVFSVTLAHNTCVTKEELLDHGRAPLWLWEPYILTNARAFPCVKSMSTTPRFPGVVHLTVEERQGVVRMVPLESGSFPPETYILDESGFVFKKTDGDEDVPSIFIAQPITIGDEFKELGTLPWDEIIAIMKQNIGNPQKIVYRKPDLEITFDTLLLHILASKGAVDRLSLIGAMVHQAAQEGRVIRRVDYRFERPVISY